MVRIMDYEKLYKEALERAKDYHKQLIDEDNPEWAGEIENIFPELKESEDEKIRNAIIAHIKGLKYYDICYGVSPKEMCDWLEKQGNITKLSEEEQNKFAKGVLTSCALSFIDYLDAHKYEGKMCVSNGECEDIENAFHNAMWDRLHRYYCKYIEKQGEKEEANGFDAELNALLKKYEHLSKEELQEPLEFYLGVVRDDLDIVREEKPKWNGADDYNVQCCIAKIENDIANGRLGRNKELIEWLKSLKQRMWEQQCNNKSKQNDYEQGYNDAIDKTCKFLNDKLPFYWALADVSNTDKFINLFIKTIKERQ